MPSWPGLPDVEFLDSHEEQHSAGVGIALGIMTAASRSWALLGAIGVFSLAVVIGPRPDNTPDQNVLVDILREPHYWIAGVGLGLVIGGGLRVVVGHV